MLRFSIALAAVVTCLFAYAFDPADYSITMAKEAISANQPNKALKIINEGLDASPDHQQLLSLKKKAQKLKKKVTTQNTVKKKKAEEKRVREKEERKQRWAAAKKTAEQQRIRERPELLKKVHCDCYATLAYNQKIINRQKQGASLTGIVNKRKLYEAGQGIIKLKPTISHLNKTMANEGVKPGECEKRKPASGWYGQFCMSYLSENLSEIEF